MHLISVNLLLLRFMDESVYCVRMKFCMQNPGQHKEFQDDKYQGSTLHFPKIQGRLGLRLHCDPFQYNIWETVELGATLDPHSLLLILGVQGRHISAS